MTVSFPSIDRPTDGEFIGQKDSLLKVPGFGIGRIQMKMTSAEPLGDKEPLAIDSDHDGFECDLVQIGENSSENLIELNW